MDEGFRWSSLTPVQGSFEERIYQSTGLTLPEFSLACRAKSTFKIVEVSAHGCNLSCSHCFQREPGFVGGMNRRSMEGIFRHFEPSASIRIPFPQEPLLQPELLSIYELVGCSEISTNGILLARDTASLDLLHERGIQNIIISLHGNRQDHCALTGVEPEVYDDLLRSLRTIVDRGFSLHITTTLYKGNLGALDYLPELLTSVGASEWWIQRIIPCGEARHWPLSRFLYGDECREVMIAYSNLKRRYRPEELCVRLDLTWGPNFYSNKMIQFLAGQRRHWPWTRFACPLVSGDRISISADSGRIYPCIFFESFPEMQIGMLDAGLSPVVERPLFSECELLDRLRGQCEGCSYIEFCLGGCRATAFSFAVLRNEPEPLFAGQDFCLTSMLEREMG